MKLLVSSLVLTFSILTSTAHAAPIDPCTGPGVAPNSWLVTINQDDQSSREDLLKFLQLAATGGFRTDFITAFEGEDSVVVSLDFDPSYYGEQSAGRKAKNSVLSGLQKLDGVLIHCNAIMEPTPRIGVRN